MSVIEPLPLEDTDAGTIGPEVVLVHEYVAPEMVDVGIKLSVSPLQICWDRLTGVLVITGTGFTVTVTG